MSEPEPIERLRRIGWRGDALPGAGLRLARVVAQHRAGYELHDGETLFSAQPDGHFLKRGLDPAARPVVGDFVELAPGRPPHIVKVLARRTVLSRAAAGERYERQLIATNIDYVLVLTGLDGDFNPARIERYLSLTEGSGAQPVVLLSKLDTREDAAAQIDALRARLPAGTPVHALNSKDPASVAQLAAYLQPGDSAVLVGSSGAGKSTLTNTLLGTARMATAEVRSHDSRGRHTTTHRALLQLPSGGCLIDTPGMRELKLTGEENLDLFADIEALAGQCRFADCGHGSEPGCAVQAALASGELTPGRWRNFLKLHDEREEQAATLEARLRRQRGGRPIERPHGHRGQRERE
ncbi:ribosome small subunit-dependent GTPase A [Rhodanobacter denitrificans]|uniref:ribosome small subunit-dependent GTPase A n=1 Tax=Rhodanobacter denitrificans TaxID=666685 RepID=UPI000260D51D|nr:ribosome small subunit-dependent GTPase A [Rhodanobacter denitrificans]EIM03743.1 GTPase RsgA [Rhodanobacter denitrificans]UJJ57176.1 ribosome small subunit-dependent GTPase A [Rhodanobacter denitrificans]UJM91036.1 ribosome small subunit-dependent GTPase A [Rhodanobacter denitrificans]